MAQRTPYRFAAAPRWVAVHAVVLVVVALFAVAGLWQLARLDERRDRNALVRARRAAPERPLAEGSPDSLAHRRVTAAGRYDVSREYLLQGRSLDDRPGHHVLTPLVLDNGAAILVDRGWVPVETESVPVREATPPSGRVTVHGVLAPDEGRGPFQRDVPSGRRIARVDLTGLARALPYRDLYPVYLLLGAQDPSQTGRYPTPAPLPDLSNGPHLLYAIQWFCFVPIALATYGSLLKREARQRAKLRPPG